LLYCIACQRNSSAQVNLNETETKIVCNKLLYFIVTYLAHCSLNEYNVLLFGTRWIEIKIICNKLYTSLDLLAC
jgi:hypothetical protein